MIKFHTFGSHLLMNWDALSRARSSLPVRDIPFPILLFSLIISIFLSFSLIHCVDARNFIECYLSAAYANYD